MVSRFKEKLEALKEDKAQKEYALFTAIFQVIFTNSKLDFGSTPSHLDLPGPLFSVFVFSRTLKKILAKKIHMINC